MTSVEQQSRGDGYCHGADRQVGNELAVETIDIVRDYGGGRGIFGISLSLMWNQILSIMGSNGAGKSCYLRCILLLDSIARGIIRINSETWVNGSGQCSRRDIDQLRGRIVGTVFQQSEPWPHLNVFENIVLPLRKVMCLGSKEARTRAEEVLGIFGVLDRSNAMPHQLSGGLRQRVVLARAFALQPKILLLDEATSALDPEWTERVGVIIRRFADEGGAVINVSHRLGLIRRLSDRVAFIDNGKVVEEGDPCSVLDHPKTAKLQKFIENA